MSDALSDQGNDSCYVDYLSFDSNIFGFKCGKLQINGNNLTQQYLENILNDAKTKKFKHIMVKLPTDNIQICNLMEENNFRLKMCSLDLEKKITGNYVEVYQRDVFLYNEKDRDVLTKITKDVFSCGTRFNYEARFPVGKVRNLYKQWISNLINDENEKVYVFREMGKTKGYITLKMRNGTLGNGHIGLFAVDPGWQGKGVGFKLLNSLGGKLTSKIDTLTATTESINYSALKTYIRSGFIIKKSWSVLHLNN